MTNYGKWLESLSVCECGRAGVVAPELVEKLMKLEECMSQGITVARGYVCADCLHRFEGYGDSGHDKGTDVDLVVIGQYYRYQILKHVTYLFPIVSMTPRLFHLSVRKDWPQGIALIS